MKAFVRILSLALTAVLLLGLLGCHPTGEPKADYFATFQPVLRFAVLSDTHIDDQGTELEEQRLVKLMQIANGYAAKDANHSTLDAVLVAGDFVDNGTLTSMEKVRDILSAGLDQNTKLLLTLGNHEYYVDKENAASRFESVFGSPVNEHMVICGFHFIKFSPDTSGNSYSSDTLSWLEQELSAAAAEDATKPIFVVQHHPVKNTLYYSDYRVGVDNLHSIFAKYPQIVDFSGHSHYPSHNPRQIWQGEYTALGTGTLSYHSLIINNLELPSWYSAVHEGNDGSWVLGHKRNKDGGEFYLVEVDAQGAVMIIAYDINADKEIRRYYIQTPSDPGSFLYTNDRIAASAAPVFADGSSVTVSNVLHNGFDLAFPQASCSDLVESYRVEVYSGDDVINTTILTSCFYMDPLPTTMVAKVRGLQANTSYTVKIFAVNAYNKDCQAPLTTTATTGELNMTPADSVPQVDILQTVFDQNGAYNAVTGQALNANGKVMTTNNSALNRPAAVMMGSNCYTFDSFKNYYSVLEQSVTFEIAFKYNEYDFYTRYPMANFQYNGIGFEIDADGMMKFSVYVGGSLRTISAYPLELGQYYHLVGTFDGEKLCMYVNGAPVNELVAPGKISWPTEESVQYLGIGGDSGLEGPDNIIRGELAVANVYSSVLTAEEVYRAYLDLTA